MVLTVAAPGILFFVYASHKISHAYVKFPIHDENDEDVPPPPYNPPGTKRKRTNSTPFSNPSAPPLYEVKRISTKRDEKSDRGHEKKSKHADKETDHLDRRKNSISENVFTSVDDIRSRKWRFADQQ